jgi:hypothetical protein
MQALLANQAAESYPTNGLVSYWSMRTSGTTVYDEWGGNDGTAVNGVLFGSAYGVRDDGAGFDGENDYMDCGTAINASLRGTNAFTVAAWVRPAEIKWEGIVGNRKQTNISPIMFTGIMIAVRGSAPTGAVAAQRWTGGTAADGAATSSSIVSTGTWSHIVMTYDSANIRLYFDGVLESTAASAGSVSDNTMSLRIGEFSDVFGGLMNGSMDEVAIWDRALTSNEVYRIATTPLYYP